MRPSSKGLQNEEEFFSITKANIFQRKLPFFHKEGQHVAKTSKLKRPNTSYEQAESINVTQRVSTENIGADTAKLHASTVRDENQSTTREKELAFRISKDKENPITEQVEDSPPKNKTLLNTVTTPKNNDTKAPHLLLSASLQNNMQFVSSK